jgi:hypothetical protein
MISGHKYNLRSISKNKETELEKKKNVVDALILLDSEASKIHFTENIDERVVVVCKVFEVYNTIVNTSILALPYLHRLGNTEIVHEELSKQFNTLSILWMSHFDSYCNLSKNDEELVKQIEMFREGL